MVPAMVSCCCMPGIALQYPIMLQSVLWLEALPWVPEQAACQEVHKLDLRGAKHHLQILCGRSPRLASGVGHKSRCTTGVKEHLDARCILEDLLRRDPTNFHDACKLLNLILPGEQGITRMKFREDASKRPHVNGCVVGYAKNHLRRAVEATLDVCVDTLILEARGAKVNDLDSALSRVLQQHILRLEVTVNDLLLAKEAQCCEKLDSKAPDQTQRDALKVVVLDKLIQVDAQELKSDAKVVPEVEVICHVHDIGRALNVTLSNVL
mmetsp:Transcript_25504/g.58865  ORF Transcript_25504/g.58865 Transcript_25504/m.58865 type:complete len:266 (+) Transcript_25504:182-979(+)